MRNNLFFIIFVCKIIAFIILPLPLNAGTSLIRDTQTENYLYKISQPIFKAANLSEQVKIYIINDNNINAFVAGGKNIFINTGTITYSDNPLGLIGIIAHETGHITGSHLARMSVELKNIKKQLALGYILGIATLISGQAEAGQALIMGSNHVGQRQFFSYSTKHEEAADEAALNYLDKAQINSLGLLKFFQEIKSNEKIYFDQINPYTRTHPLTKNRIKRIKNHNINSKYKNNYLNDELIDEYLIIKGKLIGFLQPANIVIENHQKDTDMDKVARAIAHHRLGKTALAIEILNTTSINKNPYIIELKGQFYYESNNLSKALKIFTYIDNILPNEPLIEIQLAATILNIDKQKLFPFAIRKLRSALLKDKSNIQGWQILANLYYKTNQIALQNIALAEIQLLIQEYDKAIKYANKAKESKSKNIIIKAQDIINYAKKQK